MSGPAREPAFCGACGAPLQPGDARCPSCDAAALVRCARCFGQSPIGADACIACGFELGLEPVGEPDSLRCALCLEPFVIFRSRRGSLRECPACGGQHVEHALLADLLAQAEASGPVAVRTAPPLAPVRYVACAICFRPMNRKAFGPASGVIVDVCRDHGTWLQRDELSHLIAFAGSGGLARARRRASDEQERERERVRREAVASRVDLAVGEAHPHRMSLRQSIGHDSVSDLVDLLLGHW